MKPIDAEKLITEIERQKKSIDECPFIEAELGASIKRDAKIETYNELISIISSLQQEQPKSKFVKVRCLFPFDKTWEKDKIYICEVWHHGDLNRNFWDVYYDYGKDPKYVQFSTIELLNEEFAIIQEESKVISEQSDVDLEKEYTEYVELDPVYSKLVNDIVGRSIARHFYELGLNKINK